MINSYFTIALRNLVRHKSYSIINIAGLAIGIAACLSGSLPVRYAGRGRFMVSSL